MALDVLYYIMYVMIGNKISKTIENVFLYYETFDSLMDEGTGMSWEQFID